jgi:hypothetical protein
MYFQEENVSKDDKVTVSEVSHETTYFLNKWHKKIRSTETSEAFKQALLAI